MERGANWLGPPPALLQLGGSPSVTTPRANPRMTAVAMLLLANLFWGLSFPLIKAVALLSGRLAGGGGGFVVACTVAPRFLIAAVILAVWQCSPFSAGFGRVRRDGLPWLTLTEVKHGILVGSFGAVGMLLQNDGLRFTLASTSAFLTQFYAILIPLWLAVRRRRNPGLRVWASCVIVMAGVALLGRFDWRHLRFGRGELETLLCSVFFMVQILLLEHPGLAESRPEKLTLAWLVFEAVVFSLLALATSPAPGAFFAPWRSIPWLGMTAALAVFCTVFAFQIMAVWQPKITSTEAGLIYCVEPLFGALFAIFLPALLSRWSGIGYGDEKATFELLAGGGLVTAANVLIQLRPVRGSRVRSP